METEKIMCPSSRCKQGSKLLGIRQDGMISILPQVLDIDENFIAGANEGTPAEQRFRFANKCVEGGCKQWTGSRCGVIDKMIGYMNIVADTNELPVCSIRPQCRWFLQLGAEACKICPYVITEITQEEIDDFFYDHDVNSEGSKKLQSQNENSCN